MATQTEVPAGSALIGPVMRVAALLGCSLLAACGPIETPPARAEARIALFKHCMELAAKLERKADDDVSDVVSQCSTQAAYMTNYIK